MIERPAELDGAYTCREHPEFTGTEWDAALHLRTIHNELWLKLAELQVTPLTAPRQAAPAKAFSPASRRTPKGSRRASRQHRK